MLRRGEADLVAQVRQALGAAKFGGVFAAGPGSASVRRCRPSGTRAAPVPGPPDRVAPAGQQVVVVLHRDEPGRAVLALQMQHRGEFPRASRS